MYDTWEVLQFFVFLSHCYGYSLDEQLGRVLWPTPDQFLNYIQVTSVHEFAEESCHDYG